jgi:nuclear pore complex protein Nup155
MGLFAELNHAWIAIDNCLYLWDYTHPNPQLIGFEEQSNSITAVKLIVPRPGVFVNTITHVLVVATVADIFLLGVSAKPGPSGDMEVTLYQTRMSLSIKGIEVSVIEGSSSTGRIFFAGKGNNEIYELTYQQEEKWFASRCGKINHTSPGLNSFVPSVFSNRTTEHVVDIVVDDTRSLLYTLSSDSTIRIFHMNSPNTLVLSIEKKHKEFVAEMSHILLGQMPTHNLKIISISPISANESANLHLMATTSTGIRIFISATRGGYSFYAQANAGPPTSMQVQHIKNPPPVQEEPSLRSSTSTSVAQQGSAQSRALEFSRIGIRYPPGLFLAFVTRQQDSSQDALFLSAPDSARISFKNSTEKGYYEQGVWLDLASSAQAVGLVTKPFAAASQPIGFGNELAVQFDEPSPEIAILTNNGIHIIRRRRFVDIFSAAIRQGRGDEGYAGEIKKFILNYGRVETTATALAVACGQGMDASGSEARAARVTDPETLELARKTFVEFGGNPSINPNFVSEGPVQPIDSVVPSARHEGMALYMARLVRSLWKKSVIVQSNALNGQVIVATSVSLSKLQSVQSDLMGLGEFLEKNRSFIEGLSGPESLARVSSKQDEVKMQGEHQALHSLEKLNVSIIEGISFVTMLFGEQVDQIWNALDANTRQRFKDLTYENLFSTSDGKDLAKILVKAIVNRNIASGSNVETVAEKLRRKCGSFCSPEDVIIFRAQEQLKKAEEMDPMTDMRRNLLVESLRLFEQVAGSLSHEYLQSAVTIFTNLDFFAGAIQLALSVASESDRGNVALAWVNDGKPEGDSRANYYNARRQCYELIFAVLQAVDSYAERGPETIDGRLTISAQKRNEAYDVVNESQDEVFQFDLYDWYLEQGWTNRLLRVQSPYVVTYLERLASTKVDHADLLWRFYANAERYFDAAGVQLNLAKSDFPLSLEKRIEYLSRAKANAATNGGSVGRQARQVLLHEVSELLEVANIQDDLLQRLKGDPRVDAAKKPQIIEELDGQIVGLTEVCGTLAP